MFDILKIKDCLLISLESFEDDPLNTPYQQGYKAALQETLEVVLYILKQENS